jgi:hypothetical protein
MAQPSLFHRVSDAVRRWRKTAARKRPRNSSTARPDLEPLERRDLLNYSWTLLNDKTLNDTAGLGPMILMSDGTMMVEQQGSNASSVWYQLKPDSTGSYINGNWNTNINPMNLQRRFAPATLLPDGRLFVMGGEYSGPNTTQNLTNTGEIFNPLANNGAGQWTSITPFNGEKVSFTTPPLPLGYYFGDDPTEVLNDGTVLCGFIGDNDTYIYNPALDPLLNPGLPGNSNPWSATGAKSHANDRSDEETWVKLGDGTVLTYDIYSSIADNKFEGERYNPASGTWIDASTVDPTNPPSQLSSNVVGQELGPAFVLPDGDAFFLGANGNTAIYHTATGTWSAGPTEPKDTSNPPLQLVAADSAGAILPDGQILMTLSPIGNVDTSNGPTYVYELNSNGLNQNTPYVPVTPPAYNAADGSGYDLSNENSFQTSMLVLPTGQVLLANGTTQDGKGQAKSTLIVFDPEDGVGDPSWKPSISNITRSGNTFTLNGFQLNGISEGASYGDDEEMASNYPLVWFTQSNGQLTFARTFNWSSSWVQTGALPVSTQFTTPVAPGAYLVQAIANGIRSDGALDIITGGGINNITLEVDPHNALQYDVFSYAGGTVTLLGHFYIPEISKIIVTEDSSDTTVEIESTVAGVPVFVNEGAGTDTVNVTSSAATLDNIQGPILVGNGTGFDTLNVYDFFDYNDVSWTLTGQMISRSLAAPIIYGRQNQINIFGGPGTGHGTVSYAVDGIEPGFQTNIYAKGTSAINVGYDNQEVLGAYGLLNVTNVNGGLDSLRVDDSADGSPLHLSMYSYIAGDGSHWGAIAGFSPASISYSYDTTSQLTVDTSLAMGDVIDIMGTGVPTTISSTGPSTFNLGKNGILHGTVQGIAGQLTLSTTFPYTSNIQVDDSLDNQPHTTTFSTGPDGDVIHGLAPADIIYDPSSTGSLTVETGTQPNTVYVEDTDTGGPGLKLVGSTGNLTAFVDESDGPVTIQGGGSLDAFTLGGQIGTLSQLGGPVSVSDPTGAALFGVVDFLDGAHAPKTITLTDGSLTGLAPYPITWTSDEGTGHGGVITLTIGGNNAGNVWNVLNTSKLSDGTALTTGTGADTVNIQAASGSFYDYNEGANSVTNIGSAAPLLGGTLAGILGPVKVYGSGGTQLTIDDSGDAVNRTYSLASGSLSGASPAAITWTPTANATGGVTGLAVYGGTGVNTFSVPNTDQFNSLTAINTGPGADTVNVQATTGNLTVENPGGTDRMNLGSLAPNLNGTLGNIAGDVNVFGAGHTALLLDDSGSGTARTVTLTADVIDGYGQGEIIAGAGVTDLTVDGSNAGNTYTLASSATDFQTILNAGAGNDTVQLADAATLGAALTINGGGGTDTLVGPDAGGTWAVTGQSQGTLGAVAFTAMEHLTGGAGPDIFKLTAAGKIAAINGGGGDDWLDYSAFPASNPVTVNLATGLATNVGGGNPGSVSNIADVWGGAGNDHLTGNSQGNVLVGGAGNDTLLGGSGRSVLVGGTGIDKVTGSAGDDILIGGTLSPDLNETALPLILQEWQRTDLPYAQRVAELRRGGGLNGGYKLDYGTSVLDDGGAADTLTGGGGQDWFFQFPGDQVTHPANGELTEGGPPLGGAFRRAFALGGPGVDDSYNVATDAQGDVYVIGDFQGTVNFNPNGAPVDLTAAAPPTPGQAGGDGYLAKYSPTGQLLWVQQFATDAADFVSAAGLAVDAAGSVLVTGWLTGATQVGSVTLPGTGGGANGNSIAAFVVKADSAGNILWAEQLGAAATSTDTWFWVVTSDGAGNVYLGGGFGGTQTIGGTTLTSVGTWDALVAKLGPDGTLAWVENAAAGPGDVQASGIAVDGSGNVYAGGAFEGTAQFGSKHLTSAGDYDLYALKLNSAGTVLWARDVGGAANDWGGPLALDRSGNLYLTGATNGDPSVSFTDGQAFIAKLNTTGSLLWTRAYGTGSVNFAEAPALDSSGNVYVGGFFQGGITFDNITLTGNAGDNAFIVKITSAGSVQWAHGLTGNQFYGAVVAVDASFNVYAVGSFAGTDDFDPDPQGTANLTSAGDYDGYVLELSQRGSLVYTAPASASPASYTLQLNQGYIQLVDNSSGLVVAEKSVNDTTTVQLTAANGVDTTLVLAYGTDASAVPITFKGGSGNNAIIGPAGGATWTLTGANAGKVGTVTFSNVANLVGQGTNTYKLAAGGSLSGSITGGGRDTLDYSAWTVGVAVDLTAGSATAIAGGVSGITNVFGGAGNDSLTGGTLGGLLVGGAGNDSLTGGAGRSILIGDQGSDTLVGGPDDDLLIGGTTTLDTNRAALLAILREWQRTDLSYSQRIGHLRHGGGYNGSATLVWGTTVLDDQSPDVLTGGLGLDWFFANLALGQDMITDRNNGGTEQVN